MNEQHSDLHRTPTHVAIEVGTRPTETKGTSRRGYTVIGDTIIAHDDVIGWIRWIMIAVVFLGIVLGLVMGHRSLVVIWTGAIEMALFFIRRWFS